MHNLGSIQRELSPPQILHPLTPRTPDDLRDLAAFLTCHDGADGEEDEVGRDDDGRVEQLHRLVQVPVIKETRQARSA